MMKEWNKHFYEYKRVGSILHYTLKYKKEVDRLYIVAISDILEITEHKREPTGRPIVHLKLRDSVFGVELMGTKADLAEAIHGHEGGLDD